MLFLANSNKSSSSSSATASAGSSTGGSWFSSSGSKGKGDEVDQVKGWKRELEKQARRMDRDILSIQRAEQRSISECKALAKKGRTGAVRILAKEIANTRRTIARMYNAKAQLNSVASTLQTSISMMKLQGCMVKSAEVMTAMNKLMNVKEISATMASMAREMERMGLVDEVVGEAFESMEPEGLDAEADAEVDRIVSELTSGILSPAGAVPTESALGSAAKSETVNEEATAVDHSTEELLSRLQAL